jgi:hypothetical protein
MNLFKWALVGYDKFTSFFASRRKFLTVSAACRGSRSSGKRSWLSQRPLRVIALPSRLLVFFAAPD